MASIKKCPHFFEAAKQAGWGGVQGTAAQRHLFPPAEPLADVRTLQAMPNGCRAQ